MEDKREAVVTALVLTLILAIPTAAQSVNISEEENKFFESESQGRFGSTFNIEFSENSRSSNLEGPDYSVSATDTPNRSVEVYSTAEASLKISHINSTYRAEKITTPYGTLTTGVRNGRRFETFEGLNRTRVEKIKNEIESEMESEISDLEARERSAIKSELPDLHVDVVSENGTEYISVKNNDSGKIDLSSWSFTTRGCYGVNTFTVESLTVSEGEIYRIYSGEGGEMSSNAIYETGLEICDSGTLQIYTDQGLKHTELQYS